MSGRHFSQLDGLRGIAILIVLVGHLTALSFGFQLHQLGSLPPIGVDLFFVLSGFLITNVLLQARGRSRYFINFYARRALRIAPLYAVLLIFMFAVANHRFAALRFNAKVLHWETFALYLQNVYHTSEPRPLALAGTWSLAVEEQFYLLWPLLVRKFSVRTLTLIAIAVVLFAPFARTAAPSIGYDAYVNPLCRVDAMAMGSLLALWICASAPSNTKIQRNAVLLFLLAALAECACVPLGFAHILSKTFISLMFTALLGLALVWGPLIKALDFSPLRLTGKLSYCLYLVHPIVGALIYDKFPGSDLGLKLYRSLSITVLSYSLAFLSWTFFEGPILSLKKYFGDYPPKEMPSKDGAGRKVLSPILGG